MALQNSYGQILRASSIMGSAAGLNMLLTIARTKFAALLIGTSGVGMLANYSSLQGFIGTAAGLGIQSSAVRDVAAAVARNDKTALARIATVLRRVCWLSGLAGMCATIALSPFLSRITFGTSDYSVDIAAFGLVILFGNLTGAQMALLQGARRITDIARANFIGGALSTAAAVGFYVCLGLRGIVPSLISAAGISLMVFWLYARRIPIAKVAMTWREVFQGAGSMARLGSVLALNGLLGSATSYCTILLIAHQVNLDAVGVYSAAFALSGVFVGFVLSAMSADYYPRLVEASDDAAEINALVNEQTEIGLLLAAPGLVATIALAPWVVRFFYTSEFFPAVDLLRWFVLGCLGRVASWPLGYLMLALGRARIFFATETTFNIMHLGLIALGLMMLGLQGVALAFCTMYALYTFCMYVVAARVTGFSWSSSVKRLVLANIALMVATLIVSTHLLPWLATVAGLMIAAAAGVFCLRGLIRRVGSEHRLARILSRVPGLRHFCSS